MKLLTADLRAALRANAAAHAADDWGHDPVPVVKFFNPMGAATWLATELDADGDTLFGLADLGFGCPELGYFSLSEIAALRLPLGLRIERDIGFSSTAPLSVWAEAARGTGSILGAQAVIRAVEAAGTPLRQSTDPDGAATATDPNPLPPAD
ncbi:MAG: DUF2958 domain-containing protein [Pseudomonadota bacterium]